MASPNTTSAHQASTLTKEWASAPGKLPLADLAASAKNVREHTRRCDGINLIRFIDTVLDDGFTCPKLDAAEAIQEPHPRDPHPTDCQKFYVCLNGVTPREQNCDLGEVFNTVSKMCDVPENVAEW